MCLAVVAVSLSSYGQKVDCKNPKDNAERTNCAFEKLARSEARMNKVYRATLAAFQSKPADPPDDKRFNADMTRRLQDSQRAWLDYRKSFCGSVDASFEGGTGSNAAVPLCMNSLTEEHTRALSYWFQNWTK
jgi:uncharacterized protein YecT (DUF1311 family)